MSLKIAAEKLVPSLARTQLFATSSRAFSVDGMRGFKDRERAAEEIYFKQEEHRMLKKLAEKARLQHAAESPDEFAKIVAKEKEDLLKVVGSRLAEKEVDALLEWKHHHY